MVERATILVIDDDPSIRLIARRALESFGYAALLAEDGESGVRTVREQPRGLVAILMDLSMPGMTGEETLRAIGTSGPAIPVIVMSGFEEATVDAFRAEGLVAGFLRKPFSLDHLNAALDSALNPPSVPAPPC